MRPSWASVGVSCEFRAITCHAKQDSDSLSAIGSLWALHNIGVLQNINWLNSLRRSAVCEPPCQVPNQGTKQAM